MVKLQRGEQIIGEVPSNDQLDYLVNTNWQNGGVGRHLGFGFWERTNEYYLVHGTNWQGETDWAEIVTADRIVKEIIKSDNLEILEGYPDLLEIYEEKYSNLEVKQSRSFSIRVNLTSTSKEIDEKMLEMRKKIQEFQNLKQ